MAQKMWQSDDARSGLWAGWGSYSSSSSLCLDTLGSYVMRHCHSVGGHIFNQPNLGSELWKYILTVVVEHKCQCSQHDHLGQVQSATPPWNILKHQIQQNYLLFKLPFLIAHSAVSLEQSHWLFFIKIMKIDWNSISSYNSTSKMGILRICEQLFTNIHMFSIAIGQFLKSFSVTSVQLSEGPVSGDHVQVLVLGCCLSISSKTYLSQQKISLT